MRFGASKYDASVYNATLYSVACLVEGTVTVGQVIRLCDTTAQAAVLVSATVDATAVCTASATTTVTVVSVDVSYIRVRKTLAEATVQATGVVITTATCLVSASTTVSTVGSVEAIAAFVAKAFGNVVVSVLAVVATVACYASATFQVAVNTLVARTRAKYTRFGQGISIRAAYNEGIKLASQGVFYHKAGELVALVYTTNATSTNPRYLFDGGGGISNNLVVLITTDGKVQVTYGTGVSTVTLTSPSALLRDGATWVGVGWDDGGVYLHLDGVLVASSSTKPSLVFGDYVFVGCSSSQTNSLDGILDEFWVSSRRRSTTELLAICLADVPIEWDIDTTYLLHFDGNLNYPANRQGVWVSPVQNATTATDYSSLVVYWTASVPANTAITCQVRTSQDGANWSLWYDQINGNYSQAPPGPYSQVRFILQELSNAGTPVLSGVTISYEGMPTSSVLLSGLSPARTYTFSQMLDYLIICNGVDLPKKYDGVTISDITTAPRAALTCVHKERVFMAKTATDRNTIWFSAPRNVDDWTSADITGAIVVNPSDGDEIMALVPTSMTMLIVKQHSTYYLQGYSPDTFQVTPAGEGGTISPWGVVWTPYGVFRIDRDGVWQTDFRKQILITKKIQKVWDGLNQRQLGNAALFFYKDKLFVAVPSATSNYNDTVLVYDLVQQAWSVWTGWTPACFAMFWERGQWVPIFGSSVSGNVYEIGASSADASSAIIATVETRHLPLVSEEFLKRVKWVDIYFGGGSTDASVVASFVVDGIASSAKTLTVPANADSAPFRLYPPPYGRTIGVRLQMSGPAVLQGLSLTYFPRAVRPQRVV